MTKEIEKKLTDARAEVKKLEAELEAELKKNAPKNICDEISGLPDIYKKLNCDPSKDKIYIDGFDEGQTNCLMAVATNMRICEVYNGKKKLSIEEQRWYDWYVKNSSGSGLVFNFSYCLDVGAALSSAPRLSVGKKEHLDDIRKKFPTRTTDILDL